MKTILLKEISTEQSVETISIRIDFMDDFENDFDIKFANEIDHRLENLNLLVQWHIGVNFLTGYFNELGNPINFIEVKELVESFCETYKDDIIQVTYDKKAFLKTTLTFWTYLNKEILELEPVFKEIFPEVSFNWDYEDTWEWTGGTSPNNELWVNISRKHNWEKGDCNSALVISIGTDNNTQTYIDELGIKFSKHLKTKIYYGQQIYLNGNEREYRMEKEY